MSPVRANGGESLQDMIDRYNRELLKMSAAGGGQKAKDPAQMHMNAQEQGTELKRPRPEPDEPLYRPDGNLPRPEPDEPVEWTAADGWSEQEQGLADLEQAHRAREQGFRDMEQARIDREQGLQDMEQARADKEKGLQDIEQARRDREQGIRDMEQAHIDRQQGLRDMEQVHTARSSAPTSQRSRQTEDDRWAQWLYDLEQGRLELERGLRELEDGLREWQKGIEEYRRHRFGEMPEQRRFIHSGQPWPEDDYSDIRWGDRAIGVVPTQPTIPGRVTAQSIVSGQEGNDGYGRLVVQVYTAERAEPVAGAQVTVMQPAENGGREVGRQFTDVSGKTPPFRLTVRGGESTFPSYSAPSANYLVYVTANGYHPSGPLNAQIFDGIAGVLPVELIPGMGGIH